MGGKALKRVKARRILAAEYDSLTASAVALLRELFEVVRVPPIIRGKDSFGDLDISVTGVRSSDDSEWPKLVMDKFQSRDFTFFPPTYSFEFQGAQVDVHYCESLEALENHCNFKAHGELNVYIRPVAQCLGLGYGLQGLFMPMWIDSEGRPSQQYLSADLRSKRNAFASLLLSSDPHVVLPLLGFDYEAWERGFDTELDVFRYVAASRYFHFGLYDHVGFRRTCAKRAMTARFDAFLAQLRLDQAVVARAEHVELGLPAPSEFRARCLAMTHTESHAAELVAAEIERRAAAAASALALEKLPKSTIAAITGLMGPALGEFIQRFRREHEPYAAYVLGHTEEQLHADVRTAAQRE
jgi:hypothetical protein